MAQLPRIAFMTTIGRNVGDEFIREGIRSFFDQAIGAYEPYYVDKHDLSTLHRRVYDEAQPLEDKFRDADILVQAGAPVYWNLGRSKSYNETWSQALWFDRIFQLGEQKIIFNLGAGAGQKSEDDLPTLMSDAPLIDFTRRAGRACAWTTVRDSLASKFLDECEVAHELLPCPAFHAARRLGTVKPTNDLLAVNLMRRAGHYQLKTQTSETQWRETIEQFLPRLRQRHRLIFVAHDQQEADFCSEFLQASESVFLAADYRDYMSLYSRVKGVVANRVHAAVCVAGFGRPAVIIGNDARIGIARPIGIPAMDSSEATADWITESLQSQFESGSRLAEERMELRESSARRYEEQIRRMIAHPPTALADPVVEDDNGFRFVLRPYMKPYEKILLERKKAGEQNAALAMLIESDDIVLDVGAHAGRFSVFVERLPNFRGKIYAFEPVPLSFAMLEENLRLNDCQRITPLRYAVGDCCAPVKLNLFPPEFSSWNSMGKPTMTAPDGRKLSPLQTTPAHAVSIDHFCRINKISRINFLKVDVEGFEKSVFEGAQRMLDQGRIDRICFEISRQPLQGAGVSSREVFQALEKFGYTIYRFDETQQRFVGPVRDSQEYWMNFYASATPLPQSLTMAASAAA